MLKQLLVQHIGANLALDRGIRAVNEWIGQRRPRIIGHADDHPIGRCRRDRGASRSATVFTRGSRKGMASSIGRRNTVLMRGVVHVVEEGIDR